MAISYPDFPMLTPQQMGVPDRTGAIQKGASVVDTMIGSYLKDQQAKQLAATLPYVGDQAAADLKKTQLANQYYPQDIMSQIGLRGSESGYYAQEAAKNKFLIEHPEYINPDASLIQHAKEMAAAQAQQPQNQQSNNVMPPMSPQQNQVAQPIGANQSVAAGGNPMTPMQQYQLEQNISKKSLPNSPDLTDFDKLTQSYLQNKYMSPADKAALEVSKSIDVAQGKADIEAEKKEVDNESKDMSMARQGLISLQSFSDAYDKGKRTGSFLGTLPTSGWSTATGRDYSDDQTADREAAILRGIQAQGLSARMTQMVLSLAKQSKVGRDMDPDAKEQAVQELKGGFRRTLELTPFRTYARDNLGLDRKQQNTLWQAYNEKYPYYDPKTKKMIPDNLRKFPNFLNSQEAVDVLRGKYKSSNDDSGSNSKRGGGNKNDGGAVIKIIRDKSGKLVRAS